MPRTAFTVTTTSKSGVVLPAPAAVDAPNGNSFVNTGREHIDITNGAGAPITVTFVTTLEYQGFAIADQVETVANGTTEGFGPFNVDLFSGEVGVDYSSGTTITARVVKLGAL